MAVISISGDRQWGASRTTFETLLEEVGARVSDAELKRKLAEAVEGGTAHFDLRDLSQAELRAFAGAVEAVVAGRRRETPGSDFDRDETELLDKLHREIAQAA